MKIGFLSDIHEDVVRLGQAIGMLENAGCEKIVGLGDYVGYSVPNYGFFETRDGSAVLELIRKKCEVALRGNHDLFAIKALPENQAGIDYPEDWWTLPYAERSRFAEDKVWLHDHNELAPLLTEVDVAFLEYLPEFEVLQSGSRRLMLSHYGWPDLTGSRAFFHESPLSAQPHFDWMAGNACTLGVSGHGHKEGVWIFTRGGLQKLGFGRHALPKEPCWLLGPAIAKGVWQNGFMLVDLDEWVVEVMPLNSGTHVVPDWYKQ